MELLRDVSGRGLYGLLVQAAVGTHTALSARLLGAIVRPMKPSVNSPGFLRMSAWVRRPFQKYGLEHDCEVAESRFRSVDNLESAARQPTSGGRLRVSDFRVRP